MAWVLLAAVPFLVSACEDLRIGPTDLAVHPAGDRVFVAAGAVTESIWIVDAGINQMTGAISVPAAVLAIAPDGTLYGMDLAGETVFVIDPDDRTVRHRIQISATGVEGVGGIGLNGAGTVLYILGERDILAYDTHQRRGGGVLSDLPASAFASAPWQEDVFLITQRKAVAVVRDATVVTETELPGTTFDAITTDPSGTRAYVADFRNKRVVVVDPYHRRVLATITLPLEPQQMAVDPRGSTLYLTGWNGVVTAVALPSGRIRYTRQFGTSVSVIAVHPSGSYVYVLASEEEALYVLDASTLSRIAVVKPEQ